MQKVFAYLLLGTTLGLLPCATWAAAPSPAAVAPSAAVLDQGPADWDAMEDMAETRYQKLVVKRLRKLDEKHQRRGNADRSYLVALLLAIFLGYLGIDRFYLGYPGWGLIKLFTVGLAGIMWILDIILIALGILRPKRGNYRV